MSYIPCGQLGHQHHQVDKITDSLRPRITHEMLATDLSAATPRLVTRSASEYPLWCPSVGLGAHCLFLPGWSLCSDRRKAPRLVLRRTASSVILGANRVETTRRRATNPPAESSGWRKTPGTVNPTLPQYSWRVSPPLNDIDWSGRQDSNLQTSCSQGKCAAITLLPDGGDSGRTSRLAGGSVGR